MALPLITVSPSAAAQAYLKADTATSGGASDFGAMIEQAAQGALKAGHDADALATRAAGGSADVTAVVAAVSRAELALQTTVAIRDRVVQAYQEIMRMPI